MVVGRSKFLICPAAAAALTALVLRSAEATPHGAWRQKKSYLDGPMDVVFAIDDALASDGSLQNFFSPSDAADFNDPRFALVKFNKPIVDCGPTGALQDEIETCPSIPLLYDTEQFGDVARETLAAAAAAEKQGRTHDVTHGWMAAVSTLFRPNSVRMVSLFTSLAPRFIESPDVNSAPCARYTGEKKMVTYYTPFCGSSAYQYVAVVPYANMLNQAHLLVFLEEGTDADTISVWQDIFSQFGQEFLSPLHTGVSKADYAAAAVRDVHEYQVVENASTSHMLYAACGIAENGTGREQYVFAADDAVLTAEVIESLPLDLAMKGFRFNKQLGSCLPSPTPGGLFDRPDSDGCHIALNSYTFPYSGDLKDLLREGDIEGDVFGGVRANDLTNALFSGWLTFLPPGDYTERTLILYTGLYPDSSRAPCPFETDGTFTPEDGFDGFNILCTAQKQADYKVAIQELLDRGANLIVIVPADAPNADEVYGSWADALNSIRDRTAYDGEQRDIFLHKGGVTDAIEEYRRK